MENVKKIVKAIIRIPRLALGFYFYFIFRCYLQLALGLCVALRGQSMIIRILLREKFEDQKV